MKKYKEKIRLVKMLLNAQYQLKSARLQFIKNKFSDFSLDCCQVLTNLNMFQTAVSKNWLYCEDKLKSRTNRDLNSFTNQLYQFRNYLEGKDIKTAKFTDIFADMDQLEEEFNEMRFDLQEKTISVVTENIVLQDIVFGPFEVRLLIDQIHKLHSDSPYRIIALEPNPAGTDCNVTHPHVSHERLCEGDGHIAIRTAIEQGRFFDFFTMVLGVLQNYNPDSPYVSLDDWEGICCYDCGNTMSNDENYYCESCERDFCGNCSTCCYICDTTICLGCSHECPSCRHYVCSHCSAVCSQCSREFCKDCLTDDICEDCLEQINKLNDEEEYNEENNEQTQKPQTDIEVQSNSLGQTDIHV